MSPETPSEIQSDATRFVARVRKKPSVRFYCYLGLALLLGAFNFIPWHPVKNDPCILKWEKYDEQLAREVNSMNKLIAAADAYAIIKGIPVNSVAYWDNLSDIVRNSFSHGYSYYSMKENWIAALSGRIANKHLAAIVEPNDIMKYPNAACSQQSIVLMECLKRKGVAFRPILFDHHYAVEAFIGHSWRFFDNNLEPVIPDETHEESFAGYVRKGKLSSIYRGILNPENMSYTLGNVRYGPVSSEPAPRVRLFHRVTRFLSLTLWLLPFGLALRDYCADRKRYRLAEARLLLRHDRQMRHRLYLQNFPQLWEESPEFA